MKKIYKNIRKDVKPAEVEKKDVIPEVLFFKEVNSVKEAAQLQKEGWVVVDVLSAQFGVRLKTWVLRKEK